MRCTRDSPLTRFLISGTGFEGLPSSLVKSSGGIQKPVRAFRMFGHYRTLNRIFSVSSFRNLVNARVVSCESAKLVWSHKFHSQRVRWILNGIKTLKV